MKILPFLLVILLAANAASAEELSVAGIIEASANVQMRAKTSGTIGRILVEEGDKVKEDMVLVELENLREKALIELSQAKIESAKAAVEERRVALRRSRKELQRKEIMKDVIARKELENAQHDVSQYEASVALKESGLREAEAELHLREAELENTYIRAPFDGVVTEIHVEEGETVRALEDRICDVYSLKEMFVRAAVPVGFIKFVDKNTELLIEIERETGLSSGERLKGRAVYVNPTVEPTSRTFHVRIEILDPDHLVRPGMRANVIFQLPEGVLPSSDTSAN